MSLFPYLDDLIDKRDYWLLFTYSEWLDGEKLVVGDKASDDKRSHDELVRSFLDKDRR